MTVGFWHELRRVLFGAGPPALPAPAPPTCPEEPLPPDPQPPGGDVVASRQEWAAERLLEDERLRGDLTDDEYQPLLDWALAVVDRVAEAGAQESEAVATERLEATLDAIRGVIGALGSIVVARHELSASELDARLDDAQAALTPLLAGPGDAAEVTSRLARAVEEGAASDDGADGAEVSRRVARVLGDLVGVRTARS
jgi:hypothetical protein